MWAEFEWENKVVVTTDLKSLREYLDHIMQNTNMRSRAPPPPVAFWSNWARFVFIAVVSFLEFGHALAFLCLRGDIRH